jgi:hypothetical protein
VFGSVPQKAPAQLPQRLFQLPPLHSALVHVSVYIDKDGWQRANAPAHRERPDRGPSELAESQRGRDAVARLVSWYAFVMRSLPQRPPEAIGTQQPRS